MIRHFVGVVMMIATINVPVAIYRHGFSSSEADVALLMALALYAHWRIDQVIRRLDAAPLFRTGNRHMPEARMDLADDDPRPASDRPFKHS